MSAYNLSMDAAAASETSVPSHQPTQRHFQENNTHHVHRYEKFYPFIILPLLKSTDFLVIS
jgi:hypothetical protein